MLVSMAHPLLASEEFIIAPVGLNALLESISPLSEGLLSVEGVPAGSNNGSSIPWFHALGRDCCIDEFATSE